MAVIQNPVEIDVTAALDSVGIKAPVARKPLAGVSAAQAAFNEAGAGLTDIAETTANLMRGAESDAVRLQACRFAGEVQKIIEKEVNTSAAPEVNITINTLGLQNANILSVLMPQEN